MIFDLTLPTFLFFATSITASVGQAGPDQSTMEKGLEELGNGRYENAIRFFSAAIQQDASSASAYFNRGLAYSMSGKFKLSIPDLSRAIELDPKLSKAYTRRAMALFISQSDYDKTIADTTKAITLDGADADAYLYRASAHKMKKEYGKAIADFEAAIHARPREPGAYNVLAFLLAACPEGRYRDGKKAVEHATKACELTSWKVQPCIETLAAAEAEAGRFDLAIRWQKKAIEEREIYRTVPALKENALKRLKLYEDHKPYRGDD